MFVKLADLQPGDKFRMISPLGLPDGKGWVYNYMAGNLHCCRVDNDELSHSQWFDNGELEVFKEVWELDV